VAVAGTYVPDIRETLRAVIRGTFFITPILWPTGRVPEEWSFLVDYNPLAVLVNAYRDLIINGELPDLESALWFSLFAAALFVVGLFVYNKVKHNFADLL
jgi:ABC-type polysaccharide/polyol phosphate export permease